MKTKIQVSGVKVGAEGSVVSDLSRVKRPKPSGSQAQQRLKRVREMLAAKRAKESNTKDNSKDNSRGSDDGNGQSICTRNGSEMPAAKTRSKPARANLQQATPGLSNLQRKMQQKLKGARFRWINETLYTTTGDKALEMVQGDPGIFEEYHQGFSSQVEKWPVNPVDIFIKQLQACKPLVVADMGCGEAKLAAVVGKVHTVHSFDLVAYNSLITPCNIADVPLVDSSVDVAIFCLALMGTDFIKFIREANRILR
ncbi:25S rRNA (adenine645-N1)-methyltransferase, partial [Coemansia erecta]